MLVVNIKYLKPDGKYISLNSNNYLNFFNGLLFIDFKIKFGKKWIYYYLLNRNDTKILEILSNIISQGKFIFITNNIKSLVIHDNIKMLKSRRTTEKFV